MLVPALRGFLGILLFGSVHVAMSASPATSMERTLRALPLSTPAAPAQPLSLLSDKSGASVAPRESGSVRIAHDHTHLHVFFEFQDHDVVQESSEDQRHHYKTGDVVELFLKPENASWYWEFYATPNGRKTAFFYPSRGYKGLPSTLDYTSGLKVTAHIDGTLNNWRDRDVGWTAHMTIPLAELAAAGIPLDPKTPWRILVGRYNYGRYLPECELSMFPPLTRLDFHRHEEWARLELVPASR